MWEASLEQQKKEAEVRLLSKKSDLGGRDQSEDTHELEQQPQCPGAHRELRDQEMPAPRHSKIPKAYPNSASKGHTSPPPQLSLNPLYSAELFSTLLPF